jgi:hypothetical protein
MDDLEKLAQAIIDNTSGDLFWIGEILLAELEKETGYRPSRMKPIDPMAPMPVLTPSILCK